MSNLITSKMFKELSQNDRSFLYRSKSTDGIDNSVFIHTYTKEEINFSLKEFNRVYGMVNDGTRLRVEPTDDFAAFLKIKTEILLPRDYRSTQVVSLISLLKQEIQALFLYIDGKKIPDDIIWIYASNYGTDIFVPYQYIPSFDTFKVFIEILNFRDKEYIHYYSKKMTAGSVTLTLSADNDEYFDFDSYTNDKLLIYLNGRLSLENYTSSISKDRKVMSIFYGNMVNNEIEIFYNPFIVYNKKESEVKQDYNTYYLIENNYESPIHAVIPKRTIGFYRDGLRIPIDEITQESRQIYSYKSDHIESWSSQSFYIQDANVENNKFYNSFNSDYYLNRMLGNERLLNAILNKNTDTVFDQIKANNEIDYDQILTKKSEMYDDTLADNYINKLGNTAADENYQTLTHELIRRNPSLVRNFLKEFANTSTNYLIMKDKNSNNRINIGAKLLTTDSNLKFTIFINSTYINKNQYETIQENDTTVISFPPELFNEGMNYVEINENLVSNSSNKINYLVFEPMDLLEPDSRDYKATLVLEKAVVHEFTTNVYDHLTIFQWIEKINGYLYLDSNQFGYTHISDFVIDETETTYRINFKTRPTRKFLIYFKNFSYDGTFVYEKDGSDPQDSLVFIYSNSANDPIPIVPIGIPEIYVNDTYYIYGVDYIFSTPESNNAITASLISFTRLPSKGDIISYSFNGINNKGIINSISMNYENDYGLLYFSDLEFPFSADYLDLFIDGVKVFKSNIDILSDKLIRVRNHEVPFSDIYLQSKFNRDYEDLRFLYDAYKEDDFELLIEKLFSKVDPSKLEKAEIYPDPNEIYESFDEWVGENNDKTKNPVKDKETVSRQNVLIAMYMKWLISDDARSVVANGKKLDDKVYGYFKLYQFDSLEDEDILIDCNKKEIVGDQDILLNCNIKPLTRGRRMNMILEYLKENGTEDITWENLWSLFINSPISNYIMPSDFPNEFDPKTGWIKDMGEDIDFFSENQKKAATKVEEKNYSRKITLNIIPEEIDAGEGDNNYIDLMHNGDNIEYQYVSENETADHVNIEYDEVKKQLSFHFTKADNGKLIIISKAENAEETKKIVPVSIIHQPFIKIDEKISFKHKDTLRIPYETNIDNFIINIKDKTVLSLIQHPETNEFELEGLYIGNTQVEILSANIDEESDFRKILYVTIEPLGAITILELDIQTFELHKHRIFIINILNTDAKEFDLEFDTTKVEVVKNGDTIQVKGLLEGETDIKITGKKENQYDTSVIVKANILPFPILNMELNIDSINLIAKNYVDLIITSPDAEDIKFEIDSDITDLITIKNADEINKMNQLESRDKTNQVQEGTYRIIGNNLGSGSLTITGTATDFLDKVITLPIKIVERPSTSIEIQRSTDYAYEYYEFDIKILTEADSVNIINLTSDIIDIIPIDNFNYKIHCKALGNASFQVNAQATDLDPNSIIYSFEVTLEPEDTTFSMDDNLLSTVYIKQQIEVPFESDADNITITTDKENWITYNVDYEKKVITFNFLDQIGSLNLSIIAKKTGLKEITWPLILNIQDRAMTQLSVNINEVSNLYLDWEQLIQITTNATDFEYMIDNLDKVEILKDNVNKTLLLKGKSIGESLLTIRAQATDAYESTVEIKITTVEQPLTPLTLISTLENNKITLGVGNTSDIMIQTEASVYETNIATLGQYIRLDETSKNTIENPKIDTENTVYNHSFNIEGLEIGNCELIITVKNDKYQQNTLTIPIEIVASTKLKVNPTYYSVEVDSTKNIFVDTDAEFKEISDTQQYGISALTIDSLFSTQILTNERSIAVTGIKEGSATLNIMATKENTPSSSLDITINVTPKLILNKETLNLNVGQSEAIIFETSIDAESDLIITVDPTILETSMDFTNKTITIKGLQEGTSEINLSATKNSQITDKKITVAVNP